MGLRNGLGARFACRTPSASLRTTNATRPSLPSVANSLAPPPQSPPPQPRLLAQRPVLLLRLLSQRQPPLPPPPPRESPRLTLMRLLLQRPRTPRTLRRLPPRRLLSLLPSRSTPPSS